MLLTLANLPPLPSMLSPVTRMGVADAHKQYIVVVRFGIVLSRTPSAADALACFLQAIPGGPKPAPGVNVILDLVGASHFDGNLESLTVEGKLLLVGLPSGSKAEINLALVRLLA